MDSRQNIIQALMAGQRSAMMPQQNWKPNIPSAQPQLPNLQQHRWQAPNPMQMAQQMRSGPMTLGSLGMSPQAQPQAGQSRPMGQLGGLFSRVGR